MRWIGSSDFFNSACVMNVPPCLRQRVDRTAIVRIDLDSTDAALHQEFGELLRVSVLAHAVDRPAVHGVVDHQPLLRFAAQQLVDRQAGCFAQNVPLRDVDGRQHAEIGAAPGLVRDAVEHILPEALDLRGVLAQHDRGELFQRAAVSVVAGIRFTDADDALIGMQPHPHPVRRDPLNLQVRAETDRLHLGDLHAGRRPRRPLAPGRSMAASPGPLPPTRSPP